MCKFYELFTESSFVFAYSFSYCSCMDLFLLFFLSLSFSVFRVCNNYMSYVAIPSELNIFPRWKFVMTQNYKDYDLRFRKWTIYKSQEVPKTYLTQRLLPPQGYMISKDWWGKRLPNLSSCFKSYTERKPGFQLLLSSQMLE